MKRAVSKEAEVDGATGAFLCAEHRKWTAVARGDLTGVTPGDTVRVDKRSGALPRIAVVRTAAA